MSFLNLAQARRSVREYTDAPVSDAHLATILEAAKVTPSSGNTQPWHIFAIRSPELRAEIVAASSTQAFIATSPVLLVICADIPRNTQRYGERGQHLYCLQDTAALIQNILLQATELGLGTCWIGAFKEEEVSRILRLPDEMRPIAMTPLGHPVAIPNPRPRREVEEFVTYL
ncbi:MAG: nitroreductase family protein [Oscillospiraceae bacterium]|nr:nitroreductase family protein [Oscillospiraceae bacterium]